MDQSQSPQSTAQEEMASAFPAFAVYCCNWFTPHPVPSEISLQIHGELAKIRNN